MTLQTTILRSATAGLALVLSAGAARAQTVRDPNLTVRTVAGGLDAPSTMVFIGTNDILVT